ncbi:hypothetical protein HJFPF1_10211 [Paramyrothecium foliicola]|nr:hypothetical protein HJFPF1_10211 [Paramyrothecium foliicola]
MTINVPDLDQNGTQIVGPRDDPATPLIICFHGSGDSCASWQVLATKLSQSHRVLLYNRGSLNPKPEVAVAAMAKYLSLHKLAPPYILIAHSYGGTFAREFLQKHVDDVAGMILVETGQETALDAAMEEKQYRDQILGNKPLSVIRGNVVVGKYAQLEERSRQLGRDLHDDPGFQLLEATDKEDERLKKRQLDLSTNNHYVHVPDVGHNVISDRPEVVAAEVEWVLANRPSEETARAHISRVEGVLRFLKRKFT